MEYVYFDGYPFRIVNGSHNYVLKVVKGMLLQYKNVCRVLLVNELQDKYYHYEVVNSDIKRLNCVCIEDFDRIHHELNRDRF